jgi:hypothetical protein
LSSCRNRMRRADVRSRKLSKGRKSGVRAKRMHQQFIGFPWPDSGHAVYGAETGELPRGLKLIA